MQTITVDLIGTVPCNRGRLGVSSHHVHEVARSILVDGFSRQRYRDAIVVRVPDDALAEFRRFNRDMCDGDPQLPPFSPMMKYAALTKRLGQAYVARKTCALGSSDCRIPYVQYVRPYSTVREGGVDHATQLTTNKRATTHVRTYTVEKVGADAVYVRTMSTRPSTCHGQRAMAATPYVRTVAITPCPPHHGHRSIAPRHGRRFLAPLPMPASMVVASAMTKAMAPCPPLSLCLSLSSLFLFLSISPYYLPLPLSSFSRCISLSLSVSLSLSLSH